MQPLMPGSPDEAERLRTVAAYELACTTVDPDFDRFAAMAADLFDLPIGLVNLVSGEQATVKGRYGLDVVSVPRDIAFCAHTILSDAVLAIPDLTSDARFADNPLVAGEASLRFYAGAPLRSPLGGARIGTMCVLGPKARPALDAREVRLFESLAALAMDRMELRRAELARRAAEDRLRYLVHHDTLTGCANRTRLTELIDAAGSHDEAAALVLLDLDGFKHVNDTLGHVAGDELLREVGGRLTKATGKRGTLARLGGDEFAAWLPGCGDKAQAEAAARDLLGVLTPPIVIAGRTLQVSASAGLALAAPGKAGALVADADLALYRAKLAGRGEHRTYDAAMREEHETKLALEEEVRQAALSGQFELYYQPQIDLRNGRLAGAEALLRWQHPERGLLVPAAFLHALEAGPLAAVVGDWAIEEGCRQAAAWQAQGINLRVGINLFAEQIRAGALEATVLAALDRWNLPPESLELELTETIALGYEEALLAPLHTLRARGVGLAFDDFGTGFASLSTLKKCPLTRLKIDRSFVSGLGTMGTLGKGRDRDDVAIIEALLVLARGLGLKVVAEGIETEAQAAFLAALGCDEGQGYLYSRPVPAGSLPGLSPSVESTPKAERLATRVGGQLGTLAGWRVRRRNRR